MISFSNEPAVDELSDCDRHECCPRVSAGEPRAVGQLLAAVLARYGIVANVDTAQQPRPPLEHRPTQVAELLSIGGIVPSATAIAAAVFRETPPGLRLPLRSSERWR
jgi:hypothetical protein